MSIDKILVERIISGLRRTAVKKPSKWAETYRQMKDGMWRFDRHPWLKGMHDSEKEYNVGQKAAQMGYTETLLNLVFYGIDIKCMDCLYVLPNKNPDASDFSATRFGPALAMSPHLQNLFTNTDNVGVKSTGTASLYVRGSHSRPGLKGLPINYLFLDEVAEFNEENIPLALARTDGQTEKLIWMISTPTVDGFGISKYYDERSDQRHFFFKCPSCSRKVELKFPESLVIVGEDENDQRVKESHLICTECKSELPHKQKKIWLANNEWVPTTQNRDWAGFTISQLYSTTVSPEDIARFYFRSLYHQPTEVEFYNSKLGMPHKIKGACVTDEDLDYCILHGRKNKRSEPPHSLGNGVYTMGVDVGPRVIHYEIARWQIDFAKGKGDISNCGLPAVALHGKVQEFSELDDLMNKYGVRFCVIDANPERRKAAEFAKRFFGRVKLCIFGSNISGKNYVDSKVEYHNDPVIVVDRTSWLDQALGRFRNHTISLPLDTDIEYRTQVKEPVKTYKKDHDGNPVATYLTAGSRDDHYAFSRLYNEIAFIFSMSLNQASNISN